MITEALIFTLLCFVAGSGIGFYQYKIHPTTTYESKYLGNTEDYFKNKQTGEVFRALVWKNKGGYTVLDNTDNFTDLTIDQFNKLYEPTKAPVISAGAGGH